MAGVTSMVMPKIEREAEARNYGKFIISPLEHGYGVTLGNSLRRVLLASLDGAAITSMRIGDVLHEFSDIPGVREDVVQVTLQIKQIRLKLDGVESTRVDNPKTMLDIEFTVERGRGYSPANERSGHMPIGELPVDAIYTPVKRVNWDVSSARVGQSTNYDKLTLEIWTDGTISPERALSASAKLIIDHLRLIAGINEEMLTVVTEREAVGSRLSSELAETPVEALDLSVRVFNSLKRTGITTVGDVLELLDKGESAVMSIRNFGEKSLDELRQKMHEKGFLKDEQNPE